MNNHGDIAREKESERDRLGILEWERSIRAGQWKGKQFPVEIEEVGGIRGRKRTEEDGREDGRRTEECDRERERETEKERTGLLGS